MKKNIELFIWPEIEGNAVDFGQVPIKTDIKAAIGAGASGLLPELALLFVIYATFKITDGFLSEIGSETWKAVKKGVINLASNKPSKDSLSLPPDYKGPVSYELIWWIHFNNIRILVIVKLSSQEEVEKALNLLPSAIDTAMRDGDEFSRISWNGKSWDNY